MRLKALVFFALVSCVCAAWSDVRENGLLLIKSEPAGCDIQLDGVSIGRTPRIITTLAIDEVHNITLRKAGYLDQTISVKFNGRRPVVREEVMVSASGTLNISSDPAGAEVTVNGVVRGVTPLRVEEVPKGTATVKFVLEGYREEEREISIKAGEVQELPISLKAMAGALHLSSVPEGARFYIDGEARGKGPLDISNVKPGKYMVRAELDGYLTMEKEIAVAKGKVVRREFRLSNIMGRLELRSCPVGAQVVMDGRPVGITSAKDPNAEFSDIFAIENVSEGEHTIVLKKDGYADLTRHPKVFNSKTSKHHRMRMNRIFIPDIEIVTTYGTHRGVLVANEKDYVEVEISMGVIRTFKREEVRNLRFLNPKK